MRREVAQVIGSLVRLVERDVAELRDAVVQVDEREARNAQRTAAECADLNERLRAVEFYMKAFDR